ncbi:hypothetical protein ABIF60_001774 [Bradyrhizobium japonicum]
MPLYWPQSWNDSITVIASGISSTPTNSIKAGAVSAQGARALRSSATALMRQPSRGRSYPRAAR